MDLILTQRLIKSLNTRFILSNRYKNVIKTVIQKIKQRYFITIFKSKVNEKLWRRRNIQSKNHVWVQLHII